MEDRYLFKAKRVDNGDWVRGSFVQTVESSYIVVPYKHSTICGEGSVIEIDLTTICRCTGLKDKNGKLIFENDIAKDESGNLYKAFWQDRYYQFSWICVKSDKLPIGAKWDFWRIRNYEIEVISSAIDNPELLEVGELRFTKQ